MKSGIRLIFVQLLLATLLLSSEMGLASHANQRKIVQGMVVYLVVLPAQMFAADSGMLLKNMHSEEVDVTDVQQHHVMVSIFEEKNGQRLSPTKISAMVITPSYHGPEKPLELMLMGGQQTYGNFFKVPLGKPYEIQLHITMPFLPKPVVVSFKHAQI